MTERNGARWDRPGPHPVVTTEVTDWAEVDGDPVPVLARFPGDAAGPVPVVLFCHGLGGDHRGYAGLSEHLASHGYAVLHPRFADAFAVAGPALGLSTADERDWSKDPRARELMHGMLFDPAHWRSRLRRAHAVLDALTGKNALPIALRPDRVLAAGHSFGAYTAQLLLGTRLSGDHLAGIEPAHPAVTGGVLLSPQGSGDRGLTPASWDAVAVPLLVVTGTRDRGARGEGVAWRREPFDRAGSRFAHLAVVRDGDHSLGGLPRPDAGGDPAVRTAIAAVVTAFAEHVLGAEDSAGHDTGETERTGAAAWLAADPFPSTFEHAHREDTACPTP